MKKWTFIAFAVATLALAGCAENNSGTPDHTLNDFFLEDAGQTSKHTTFFELQSASGARHDAMLSKQHFDGAKLNSLGEQKLSLMLNDDDAPAPLNVYLNMPEAETISKQRKEAVLTYLKDQNIKETQVQVVYGDNPATRSPAARHLANMSKTDTGVAGAEAEGTGSQQAGTDAGANSGGSSENTGGGFTASPTK